jgi:hypothetical protein
MAVRADQFAVRDLVEDRLTAEPAPDQFAHLGAFRSTGQVIPVHGGMVKARAAVSAWFRLLEFPLPLHELAPKTSTGRQAGSARTTPVLSVVPPAALLAPRLLPAAAVAVKLGGILEH